MNALVRRATAWALRLRLVRAFLLYTERRGAMLADSITYRALFSIFAAVLLGFSLAALWLGGDPDALRALRDALERVLPGLSKVVDPTAVHAPVGFTVVGALSLIGLVGAAISAIGSLRTALRVLSGELHDDGFFLWTILRNLLVGVAFGGLLIVAAVLGVAASSGVETVSGWLGWSARSIGAVFAARALGILIVFAIDLAAIALAFRLLSGVRAPARALWTGAALGALALTILLWVNLSAQAILIASSYIITATAETHDRVRLRYGAETFAQRRRQQAEDRLQAAKAELLAAQEAEREEREALRPTADLRE
ncbi:YihY/virulence factor BrkB family protein [Leucobacter sp. HNU]|uniref:YihY/virulence factor BrkB family protein n=1 Tax=Leucobacter sp. HNU TaxID=3236805 RepID=UPI003A7FC6DC